MRARIQRPKRRAVLAPGAAAAWIARIVPVIAVIAVVLGIGCATTEPSFEDIDVPPADELYEQGLETLEGLDFFVYRYVNYTRAIETFQQIIDNYPYSEYSILAELKIADAYFDDGKYEEALSYYRDFADLHPQNEKVPYTIWRSALSYERRKRGSNRDQTATREAIVFLDRLLASHPRSEYTPEAERLWRELQILLAKNVEGIADFYRSRTEFEAAAERYRTLLNEFPGLGIDARVLFKLAECYEEMNRLDEADRIFRTIMIHYADSRFARRARQKIDAGP